MRTSHTIRRVAAVALLGVAPMFLGGCLAAAVVVAGAATYGAVKYTDNGAYEDFDTDLRTTWNATLVSMQEQGYLVATDAEPTPTGGTIESGDAKVDVSLLPGKKTRVTVKIGTFETEDHQRRARLLLERIEKELD